MPTLHIVQGGIDNGDKAWLEKAARKGWETQAWVVPKTAEKGDEVVIYIAGFGFFATAKITTTPVPKERWDNRYGAGVTAIKLIEPSISLAAIRRSLPTLTWAEYPRSITTPSPRIADRIRDLIRERRLTRLPDIEDQLLDEANLAELRAAALAESRPSAPPRLRLAFSRLRSPVIHRYVLQRSKGTCEGCNTSAPFCKADDSPYLEPHHTTRLADEEPDHPAHVIALCPTCHRRAHHSKDAITFNNSLKRKLRRLEPRRISGASR